MSGGSVSAPIRARLDTLLTIEEILGAAVFDAAGRVEAVVNLYEHDALSLFTVLSSAVSGEEQPADRAPAFAAFTLSEGQIAISRDHHRAVITLTDPGLDAHLLRRLLADLLADLAATAAATLSAGLAV
jgi:hypothetical protein